MSPSTAPAAADESAQTRTNPDSTLRAALRATRRAPVAPLAAAALIATPVAVMTTFDIQERTAHSADWSAERNLGGADASVDAEYIRNVHAPRTAPGDAAGRAAEAAKAEAAFLAALPAGVRAIPAASSYEEIEVSVPGGATTTVAGRAAVLGEPMHRQYAELTGGTAPGPDGIALDARVADRLGLLEAGKLRPGAEVRVAGRLAPVTGLVRDPYYLISQVAVVVPGSALDRAMAGQDEFFEYGSPMLLDLPDGESAAVDAFLSRYQVETRATMASWAQPAPTLLLPSPSFSEDDEDQGALDLWMTAWMTPVWLAALAALAVFARPAVRRGLAHLDGRRTRAAYGAVLGLAGGVLGLAAGAVGAVVTAGRYEESLNGVLFAGGWSAGPAELGIFLLVAVAWGVATVAWATREKRFSWPVAS